MYQFYITPFRSLNKLNVLPSEETALVVGLIWEILVCCGDCHDCSHIR